MHTDRNLRTRLLLAVPVALTALSLAACSGGAQRPSEGELSSGIQKILDDSGYGDQFTAKQVDCIAGELLDTKISDQNLSNLAEGKDVQTDEKAKNQVAKDMGAAVQTCSASK